MVPLSLYLTLSAILFTIGLVGLLVRRNVIIILMCTELMLNAVTISLAAFSKFGGNIEGQIFAIFLISIAAAEAAVGLAMVLVIFRHRGSVKIDDFSFMKW